MEDIQVAELPQGLKNCLYSSVGHANLAVNQIEMWIWTLVPILLEALVLLAGITYTYWFSLMDQRKSVCRFIVLFTVLSPENQIGVVHLFQTRSSLQSA